MRMTHHDPEAGYLSPVQGEVSAICLKKQGLDLGLPDNEDVSFAVNNKREFELEVAGHILVLTEEQKQQALRATVLLARI